MSDYTPITDFSVKDGLASGDPEKTALGADIDAELAAIETAIASKADEASTPTLAGNTFTSTQAISATTPRFELAESDQASDEKRTAIEMRDGDFMIHTRSDALADGTEILKAVRGTGTAVTSVAVHGQIIKSGTYTPTLTADTNVAGAGTPSGFRYIRIGSQVQVAGLISGITASAGGTCRLDITLPIASNIGGTPDAVGVSSTLDHAVALPGQITGDIANDKAQMNWTAVTTGSHTMYISFMYEII